MKVLKSIVLLLVIMIFATGVSYAGGSLKKTQKQPQQTVTAHPQIKVNNEVFTLKFATNKTQSGEYLNEYYKPGEGPSNWTEMITVSEFPNYPNKPMDYVEAILTRDHSPNNYDRPIVSNSKSEKTTFVFLLTGKTDEAKYVEFNIMQVMPYKNSKGLKTLQYAKKYYYTDREDYTNKFKDMEDKKMYIFTQVKDLEMPEMIRQEIE